MEAIPKSDLYQTVIKSDIRFDISIKPTTWIGHEIMKNIGFEKQQKASVFFS